MLQQKKFASSAKENGGGEPAPNTPKKVNTISNLPSKDSDFGTLGSRISDEWKLRPRLTLEYITQPQFETKVNLFNTTLASRIAAGGNVSPLAQQLSDKDTIIENAISGVKGYLKDKYEKNAPAYYPLFAISKKGSRYLLPTDRDVRKDTFDLIIASIASEGFGSKKYGTAFWTQMKTDYLKLLKDASTNTGKVSGGVGTKNTLKAELEEVYNSIIHIVKGNYPKSWEAELRKFGFTKENY